MNCTIQTMLKCVFSTQCSTCPINLASLHCVYCLCLCICISTLLHFSMSSLNLIIMHFVTVSFSLHKLCTSSTIIDFDILRCHWTSTAFPLHHCMHLGVLGVWVRFQLFSLPLSLSGLASPLRTVSDASVHSSTSTLYSWFSATCHRTPNKGEEHCLTPRNATMTLDESGPWF